MIVSNVVHLTFTSSCTKWVFLHVPHPAITVGLEAASYPVSETEGVLTVCAVIINGQTERDVSVEFSVSQMPDTTAQGR